MLYRCDLGSAVKVVDIVVSEHDHWGGFRPDHIDRVAAGGATESEAVEA